MKQVKRLPSASTVPKSPDDLRRDALRSYLHACMTQNIVSPSDLRFPIALLAKLGFTMLEDIKAIGAQIVKNAGSIASAKAAEGFMELALEMATKRGK